MSEIIEAAREWIRAGFWVFPVRLTSTAGKKDPPQFPGSWNQATNDLTKVAALFDRQTGIAISTGLSGVVGVDVDISETKDGFNRLIEAGISLPDSPMKTRTWSGGQHLIYRQPQNRIGTAQNRPVRDVDIRGEGGALFVPPTVVLDSETGLEVGKYVLEGELVSVSDLPVLSEAFATKLRDEPRAERIRSGAVTLPSALRDDQRARLEFFVKEDLTTITRAGNGERNEVLGRTVLKVADRCIKLGLDYDDFEEQVLGAYQESGGVDDRQAIDHCDSAWKKALRDPLDMPETQIDTLVEERYQRMVIDRLAKQKLNGVNLRLLGPDSFVDWTLTPDPPKFWVNGIIPQGEQAIMYGKPEAGKTFMAIDWAMSVACGRKTFGRSTTKGRVLYMSGEGNARITSRMHAWIQHTGLTPSRQDFYLTNHVPDLMNEAVIENLAIRVAEDEYDLVIIDTLGRAMAVGGGDISSPPDAAVALKNMQTISKYRLSTTPLVLHHPIKDGSMAGAYNLNAGVDVSIYAEVDENTGEGELSFAKNKDGVKGSICAYRWVSVGQSAVLVDAITYGRVDTPGQYEYTPDQDPFQDEERRSREERE